jgi:hypothetical protein
MPLFCPISLNDSQFNRFDAGLKNSAVAEKWPGFLTGMIHRAAKPQPNHGNVFLCRVHS